MIVIRHRVCLNVLRVSRWFLRNSEQDPVMRVESLEDREAVGSRKKQRKIKGWSYCSSELR